MIAHPAVIHRLNWMEGSGFRCGNATAICSVKGTAGHAMHSGSDPARPGNSYFFQNGRTYCDSVNVAWQLRDVTEADGGFVCLPGSHKARYPMPPGVQSCDEPMGLVPPCVNESGGCAYVHGGRTNTRCLPVEERYPASYCPDELYGQTYCFVMRFLSCGRITSWIIVHMCTRDRRRITAFVIKRCVSSLMATGVSSS